MITSSITPVTAALEFCYAKFFTNIGWFWDNSKNTLLPSFFVRFECSNSECREYPVRGETPGTHSLLGFINEDAQSEPELNSCIQALETKYNRNRYDAPNIAVFGKSPKFSLWEMVHGNGGGVYSVPAIVPDWKLQWESAKQVLKSEVLQYFK